MEENDPFEPSIDLFPGGHCCLKKVGDEPAMPVYISESFCRMAGSDCTTIMAQSAGGVLELIHPDDREACSRKVARGIETGEPFVCVFRIRPIPDQPVWVNANCNVVREGEVSYIYGTCTDVGGEVRTRERLAHAGQHIQDVMEVLVREAYDLIAEIDLAGGSGAYTYRVFFEDGVTLPFGAPAVPYDADAALEKIRPLLAGDEAEHVRDCMRIPDIRAALEESETYDFLIRLVEPDGSIATKKRIYRYLDDERTIVLVAMLDVTDILLDERRQRDLLESALVAANQASAAKSNFLSRMSHEIRTPMNAIIGMSTLAAQAIGDDACVSDCISKIGISARYLLSLINDILDMSRIESGHMLLKEEKFSLPELISSLTDIIDEQATAKGLDYECTVSNEVEESYFGDVMKLQQVLINVLGNAVKYTDSGRIALEVHQASCHRDNALVRFTVSDTGCGIAEDFMERIFDPFEQEDASTTSTFSGTGLGLAICRSLLDLMGGSIKVRSIVDVGSEFTVEVPLRVDESVTVKPHLDCRFEKMFTLVVDDDAVACEQTVSILTEIGMAGEWVTSGREAIERVHRRADRGDDYDFIIIDWKMPEMDGVETARRIRTVVGPEVTIIMLTAYDWSMIETEARAAGVNLLISKPLFKSSLMSAFQKAVSQDAEEVPVDFDFDFTGKRALIAEDNALNAEIASRLLESRHFTTDIAVNGLRAMEMFTTKPVGYYDVILMDVRMPLMDGLQATMNIRNWNKEDARTVPIVAMTANAFDEDVEKCRAAGMDAHLAKPIEPALLFRTLYRLIYQRDDG